MTHYFILKIHFALALYMTGVIWLVQGIHYPLFKLVGESTFKDYHKAHTSKTIFVIAVPMILEISTGLYLIINDDFYRSSILFLFASAFLLFIWCTTFLISVPKHNILAKSRDERALSMLIKTNWIRTIAWSIRAIILFALLD